MKNKNILVTGGTGLIGSFLVEKLVKGNNVKCLVLKNTDIKVLDNLDVEIVYGNLSNIVSLKNAVKDVDIVFNLAAAFKKDLPKDASEEYYFKVNVDGTENLLRVCLENEIQKVIHLSACGVYGHNSDMPINEESPYRPTNSYERSKCEGEKVALRYNNLGLQYMHKGDLKKAKELFEKALKISPTFKDALTNLEHVKQYLGEK